MDIGIHQDGLVHLSQLANRFVKDPHEVVSPGDRVEVRILEVNLDKKQLSLTMKQERPAPPPRQARPEKPRPRPKPQPRKPPPPRERTPELHHNPFAALAVLKTSKNKKG